MLRVKNTKNGKIKVKVSINGKKDRDSLIKALVETSNDKFIDILEEAVNEYKHNNKKEEPYILCRCGCGAKTYRKDLNYEIVDTMVKYGSAIKIKSKLGKSEVEKLEIGSYVFIEDNLLLVSIDSSILIDVLTISEREMLSDEVTMAVIGTSYYEN